jgi:hypothetical protein
MWSCEGRLRLLPGLRVLATAFNGIEGIIPLHGGLPPASAFPLSAIQLTLKDGTKIDITEPQEVNFSAPLSGPCLCALPTHNFSVP